MKENEIAQDIVDAAFRIHSHVGPGCLETAYEMLLTHELQKRGRTVEIQLPVAVEYDGVSIREAFRIDLLVDDCVVVELKAVEELHPVHFSQVLTYLKFSKKKLSLLINFNSRLFKKGVHRIVNGLEDN